MNNAMITIMNNMIEEYLCASFMQLFIPFTMPASNQAPSYAQSFFEKLPTELEYRDHQFNINRHLPQAQNDSNATGDETSHLREQLRCQDEKIANLENAMLQQSATIAQLSDTIATLAVND